MSARHEQLQALRLKTEALAVTMVGMEFSEAEKLGKAERVWVIGPGRVTTRDLRVDRIFVELDSDSRITSFSIG